MSQKKHRYLFPIVGLGASAGGLEALEQFFRNIPENSGMAFIVIQHLDPTRKGVMPEILQRFTRMKVTQASDMELVQKNCVYVIPPNKSISLMDGFLHLLDPIESRGQRLPIDTFFRSLAAERSEKAIGIILSGMGSDGSLGIRAIKEENGIVIVQDPADAKFDSMPANAIKTANADIVATAAEIPERLMSFLRLLPTVRSSTIIDENRKSELGKIIILIREQTGHDFSQYKKSTIYRRVERRSGIHQIEKIQNYVRFLQENPVEVEILFKELLIGVTNFFRDAALWDNLKDKVLPDYLGKLPDDYTLRIWIPGCSTGEEVYSWAILLKEVIETSHKKIYIQIFGTDLDQDAINFARRGIFMKNIRNDVSPDRLKRFFVAEGDNYRVVDFIREMVVFAAHNVIKHPPFTKLDILSCRNMLIYMEPELQKIMANIFTYSVKAGGLLVLGTSETIVQSGSFKEIDTRGKIYQHAMNVPFQSLREISQLNEPMENQKINKNENDTVQSSTEKILLTKFSPSSVLVNDQGDILYLTGKIGKYLEPAAGKANWNIHVMVRDVMRQDLLMAFRKALQGNAPVIVHNVKIDESPGSAEVNITIQKLDGPDNVKGLVLIVFSEAQKPTSKSGKEKKNGITDREKELEQELKRSYEDLQSITEEMQASQEELRATNEELQSANEELQSTNEELTTSKEEMQSMNEELQTVNSELQNKVAEFTQAETDMKNLLNSTEIATLFLDKSLNIRRYTDTVKYIIKLRKSDIGRPVTELTNDLQYPDIETDAMKVLDLLVSVERPIKTNNNKWFKVRIMPYRSVDDRIDGLVITFNDISVYKNLENELEEARDALRKNIK